jgi:hypothetical protein
MVRKSWNYSLLFSLYFLIQSIIIPIRLGKKQFLIGHIGVLLHELWPLKVIINFNILEWIPIILALIL